MPAATTRRTLIRDDLDPTNLDRLLIVSGGQALRPVLGPVDAHCSVCDLPWEKAVTFTGPGGEPSGADPMCVECFADVIPEDSAEGVIEVYLKAGVR